VEELEVLKYLPSSPYWFTTTYVSSPIPLRIEPLPPKDRTPPTYAAPN